MKKNKWAVIFALLILAIALGSGGWFWSSQYLLAKAEPEAVAVANGSSPQIPKSEMNWKEAIINEKKAAQTSIIAQLEAFKRDDWAKASTYQSNGLKRKFPSLQTFQQVIEKQYPQFADYQKIDFLGAKSLGPHVNIYAKLTGRDGKSLNTIYMMVKENGVYRVAGVNGGTPPPQMEDPAQLI